MSTTPTSRRRLNPSLEPVARILDYLVAEGRTTPIPLRTFHFLLAHGAAAPFTLAALARHFDTSGPLEPAAAKEYADLAADLIIRALKKEP